MNSERLPRHRFVEIVAVIVLLALHGLLAITSSRSKSATFDEIAHLGGGFLRWADGDERYNAESGALVQRWAAAPLRILGVTAPDEGHPARADANVWVLGRELLYELGNSAETLLIAGRSMIVLLSMLLGAAVYSWSRVLFGRAGAWISLGLYVLSPTILAHARLITADLAAALGLLLATRAIWSLLQRATVRRILTAAAATAALLLSKNSGLLILPVAVVLVLVRWRTSASEPGPSDAPPARRGLSRAVGVFAAAGLVYCAIWAAYGFRYSARPEAVVPQPGPPAASTFLHSWDSMSLGPVAAVTLGAVRHFRLLPEAYVWGLAYTLQTTRERDAFLRGETSATGWWWFFPYAVAVKTPLALFVVLGLAALAWWRGLVRPGSSTVPLWTLLAVYWLAAIVSHLNIGHRHMLPTYPVTFILAGAAGAWLCRRPHLALVPALVPALVLALALAAFAWGSAAIHPHYLAYFNQLAGGPEGGYRHLADSSLDWGQDLPLLAAFLAEQDADPPVYVAYFGAAPPAYYGAEARWLYSFFPVAPPNRPPVPLTGGTYCVSVTLLQTLHMELRGPWTAERERTLREHRALVDRFVALSPSAAGREELLAERSRAEWLDVFRSYDRLRSGRLFRCLLAREPDARIGYSIHVYRLSDAEVARAEAGPVPPWPGGA